jgi:hypothetical protein
VSALGNGRTTCTDCGRAINVHTPTTVLGVCAACDSEPAPSLQCGTPGCNAEIASGDRLDAEDAGWVYYKEPGEWACAACIKAAWNAEAPVRYRISEE